MNPELSPILLSPAFLGLLGLLVGSFLNVVIHRLPLMLDRGWKADCAEMFDVKVDLPEPITLSTPRSRCPKCGHQITWYENIPVVSWLVLRGRCSACKAPISARYPLVEIATAGVFAAVAWRVGPVPLTLLWCGVMAVLIALTGIDWDTTLLPDDLTLPLLWAGLIAAGLGWTVPMTTALWGAVAGYLSLWSIYWIFKLATGKEGMGYGDFKLLAALGAWLGVQMVLPVVLGAAIVGAVVGIGMKLASSLREGGYVPFGPFLAGSAAIVMLAGPERVLGWIGWA